MGGVLARARSGDEAAFLELWRGLQPRLLRYLRVLGCDDPDYIASETWLQVVRDLHRFDGDDDGFRRWLFTVGRNRAIDAARASTRRRVNPVADGLEGLADGHTVEEQVLDDMSVRKAIALLAGLSRDQAEAGGRGGVLAGSSPLASPGDIVVLQVWSGTRWRGAAMRGLNGSGQVTFMVRAPGRPQQYRMVLLATANHGLSVSNTVTVSPRS